MRAPAVMVIAVLLASASLVQGQRVGLDKGITAPASLSKPDAEYRLGAGDLIEVSVFGVDNFRHTLRLNAAGFVKLPLLEPIAAAGLTPGELEQQLASLLDKDIIKNPQVSVFVKEYRSQSVYVLGAVRSPGQYQIALQLKLVDVISMAGGLLPNADDEAVIQRAPAGGGEQTIPVNLRQLLESGDLSLNVVVRGGDVVHVRERVARTVYILGDVNRAGAFPIPPRQDLRVTQVFAWAGGATKTAKLSKGVLLRYSDKGEREELPVNFTEIFSGKKEDFVVRADDIIFVPNSKLKNVSYSLLSVLPAMVATLPYGVIY